MHAWNLIPICTACLLAACTGAQNSQAPQDPAAPSAAEAASPQISTRQPEPEPRAPVRNGVRAAPMPPPTPNILIGLASDAVDKLLGKPDLVRRDGPAEVRLYGDFKATCTFHVFLYAKDAADPAGAVEYFEARNSQGRLEGAEITECYVALVKPAVTS